MPFLGLFKKQPPKRSCTHCGAILTSASTDQGNAWECPQCHNTIHEHHTGTGSALSITISSESGPRDLITEQQKQFLIDLGETSVPRFKDEASSRIDVLIGSFDSWLAACFRKRDILERPDQRLLQIAMHKARLQSQYPRYGGDLSEAQRVALMQFVKDCLGETVFLAMAPVGITKYAEVLGIKARVRKQKPKQLDFSCPNCGQTYSAPEEMADQAIQCHKCHAPMRVPRPTRGYFAAPSEPQIEEAELYGIQVLDGMHRGQLKEEIAKAQSDRSQQPSAEAYGRFRQRKLQRQLRDADDKTRAELLEEERQYQADLRRDAREDAREEAELRRALYEDEFARDGDWAEFYRKPTRQQYDQIYAWLDRNKPGWGLVADVAEAIDQLFPELKK
jgi:predicted RNA-binding Zn-ribbon protein involved in translation (DUF1610 family)